MIKLLWRFILVMALAAGFAWIADRPGTLTIRWLGREIEMSVIAGVVAAVIAVLAIWFLWSLFRRLRERGTTLLISSHVMDEATRCDRLMLMRRGVILADETPDGLLEKTGTTTAEAAFLVLIAGGTHGESGEER